ncbi:MAG TPA: EAL domain-containing protein [Gammaproteobacteria bacterium]|nr:EAL domain-containing protein [Gammaproteobacteria bacterium]
MHLTVTKVTSLTTWLAALLAIAISIILPAGYFGLTYQHQISAMQTEAEINALLVTRLINSNPELWQFETHRLQDLVQQDMTETVLPEVRRITGAGNQVIAESAGQLAAPVVTRSDKLFSSGEVVGEMQISRSFRPVLMDMLLVALGGILLGATVYTSLRVFPLRALRDSLDLHFQEKERAQVTLQSIGDAVITTDANGAIEYLNPVAEELTGWSNAEAQGLPLPQVFDIINEGTGEAQENPVDKVLAKGCIVPLANHTALRRRDGTSIPIEDSAAPIRDRAGYITGVVLVFHDVSSAREFKQRLTHQATHDALTNLANRREFELRLQDALSIAKAQCVQHAVCYFDLDQFKIINDTCGHMAGDELLRQLSAVLEATVRQTDTLARLGGDEFGLLLMNCEQAPAERIVNNLMQSVRDFRFNWRDESFVVSVSAGLVPVTAESESMAHILSTADAACYIAKESGRNRVHVYRDNDKDVAHRRGEMSWVARINEALDQSLFCLYRQTIAPLDDSHPGEHFEVLVRMKDKSGQLILPAEFIPAAERYNLMPAIDRWVIQNTFALLNKLYGDNRQKKLSICTINLSGLSLSDESFLEFIRHQGKLLQATPRAICFEITETAAIANINKAITFMSRLKELGFSFSLDDFGSGLSSFTYLKNLPIDYLKIDGSFVKNMLDNALDFSIVSAVNQIGHTMGVHTVAEFVENTKILGALREMGMDYAQGYGVSRPEPFSADTKL